MDHDGWMSDGRVSRWMLNGWMEGGWVGDWQVSTWMLEGWTEGGGWVGG